MTDDCSALCIMRMRMRKLILSKLHCCCCVPDANRHCKKPDGRPCTHITSIYYTITQIRLALSAKPTVAAGTQCDAAATAYVEMGDGAAHLLCAL